MKATLKNYRQSPRKVRLVADSVRGKSIPQAFTSLQTLDKKASLPILKLIQSAVENAKESGNTTEQLRVASIRVDEGQMLKRYRPRAFGRATPLRKRSSTIHITLTKNI